MRGNIVDVNVVGLFSLSAGTIDLKRVFEYLTLMVEKIEGG